MPVADAARPPRSGFLDTPARRAYRLAAVGVGVGFVGLRVALAGHEDDRSGPLEHRGEVGLHEGPFFVRDVTRIWFAYCRGILRLFHAPKYDFLPT